MTDKHRKLILAITVSNYENVDAFVKSQNFKDFIQAIEECSKGNRASRPSKALVTAVCSIFGVKRGLFALLKDINYSTSSEFLNWITKKDHPVTYARLKRCGYTQKLKLKILDIPTVKREFKNGFNSKKLWLMMKSAKIEPEAIEYIKNTYSDEFKRIGGFWVCEGKLQPVFLKKMINENKSLTVVNVAANWFGARPFADVYYYSNKYRTIKIKNRFVYEATLWSWPRETVRDYINYFKFSYNEAMSLEGMEVWLRQNNLMYELYGKTDCKTLGTLPDVKKKKRAA